MGDDPSERIETLERANSQLHERINALQHVVSWLLAKQPSENALRFLSAQANELEPGGKFSEQVALFDQLADDVAHWHVLFSDSQGALPKNTVP